MLRFGLLMCMVFSVAIHGMLFFLLPGISPPPFPAEDYTEVELRRLPSPISPVELTERASPPEPAEDLVEEPTAEPEPPVVAEVAPPAPIDDAELSALLDEDVVSLGLGLRPPAIDIDPPTAQAPGLQPEIALPEEPLRTVEDLFDRLGGGAFPPGSVEAEGLPTTITQLEKLEREPMVDIELGDLMVAERTSRQEVPSIHVAAAVAGADVEIRGPASERGSPIYWPPSPEIAVVTETLIMLKFWVLPDGRVGQVLPVRIDDAALEAEGIKFVSALRFRPLASFEKQERQWGLISLIFKSQ